MNDSPAARTVDLYQVSQNKITYETSGKKNRPNLSRIILPCLVFASAPAVPTARPLRSRAEECDSTPQHTPALSLNADLLVMYAKPTTESNCSASTCACKGGEACGTLRDTPTRRPTGRPTATLARSDGNRGVDGTITAAGPASRVASAVRSTEACQPPERGLRPPEQRAARARPGERQESPRLGRRTRCPAFAASPGG